MSTTIKQLQQEKQELQKQLQEQSNKHAQEIGLVEKEQNTVRARLDDFMKSTTLKLQQLTPTSQEAADKENCPGNSNILASPAVPAAAAATPSKLAAATPGRDRSATTTPSTTTRSSSQSSSNKRSSVALTPSQLKRKKSIIGKIKSKLTKKSGKKAKGVSKALIASPEAETPVRRQLTSPGKASPLGLLSPPLPAQRAAAAKAMRFQNKPAEAGATRPQDVFELDLDEVPVGGASSAMPVKEQVKNKPAMVPCKGCKRSFVPEALDRHKKICKKVFQTKRKEFKVQVLDEEVVLDNAAAESAANFVKPKNNWREQRNSLREAIKASREYQKQLAANDVVVSKPKPKARATQQAMPTRRSTRSSSAR